MDFARVQDLRYYPRPAVLSFCLFCELLFMVLEFAIRKIPLPVWLKVTETWFNFICSYIALQIIRNFLSPYILNSFVINLICTLIYSWAISYNSLISVFLLFQNQIILIKITLWCSLQLGNIALYIFFLRNAFSIVVVSCRF